jgi:Xaa-Pro aminopeptidase
MFELYSGIRWPNMIFHLANDRPFGHTGISRFSKTEIARRQDLVRAKLKAMNCDLFITQGWFPTATFGCHSSLYWLSGYNGYRNTMTLILPVEGELAEIPGVKACCNLKRHDPYTGVEDLSPHILGAKRIAYDGLGYLTAAFKQYLEDTAPGVEVIDFSNEIEHMKAIKGAEEIELIKDAVAIQERIFASAANYIYPGRAFWEITADITRQMVLWGADPTLMGKVLIGFGRNGPFSLNVDTSGANAGVSTRFADDPNYRLQRDDYVGLMLEAQGSGGYYATNGRSFFFSEPHPEIREVWDEAVKMLYYTASLLRPGVTGFHIHRMVNAYKVERGFEPMVYTPERQRENLIHGCFLAEISGIGINTIDRPQPQFIWEDIVLEPGHSVVIYGGGEVRQGSRSANAQKTCVITEGEPLVLGEFPMELIVL